MRRPVVLVFIAYYLPGYKSGGPLRTIANMVQQLGDQLDFRIVTCDRDVEDPSSYPNVVVDGWNPVGRAYVYYSSSRGRSFLQLRRLIASTPHDILYLNSFFDVAFTLKPIIARYLHMIPVKPTVVAPRGEFSLQAIRLKRWKKKPYVMLTRVLGLFQHVVWQASSEYESFDIRRELGRTAQEIIVAPDLVPSQIELVAHASEGITPRAGALRIAFLSRISPKKNLQYALRTLAKVSAKVEFDIYGVVSDPVYWRQCAQLIAKIPDNVRVRYIGAIAHSSVIPALANYDLFFFPTLGENFGHVIVEAWAAGLPVLISDQTPWRDLDLRGVGWDLPLADEDAFVQVIEDIARRDPPTLALQRQCARDFAASIVTDEHARTENLELFSNLLNVKAWN